MYIWQNRQKMAETANNQNAEKVPLSRQKIGREPGQKAIFGGRIKIMKKKMPDSAKKVRKREKIIILFLQN